MSRKIFYLPKNFRHNFLSGFLRQISTTILLAGFLAIGGCGGGGGSSTPPVPTPPDPPPSPPPEPTPADYETPEYESQYGLGAIGASAVYVDEHSGEDVLVAVIDNGVDLDHPDLVDNIAEDGHYDFTDCYQRDNDGNSDNDCTEEEKKNVNHEGEGSGRSHGTQIAGIIAAAKNGIGMHGVAYNAKILALRATRVSNYQPFTFSFRNPLLTTNPHFQTRCTDNGDGTQNCEYFSYKNPMDPDNLGKSDIVIQFKIETATGLITLIRGFAFPRTPDGWKAGSTVYFNLNFVSEAIDRAIAEEAKVINLSLAGSFNTRMAEALRRAHDADIISVIAAGNARIKDGEIQDRSKWENPLFHAFLPSRSGYEDLKNTLIAVVATDRNNEIAEYSNRCGAAKEWCLAAPGNYIYTTVDGGDEARIEPDEFYNRKYREELFRILVDVARRIGAPDNYFTSLFPDDHYFLRNSMGEELHRKTADGNPREGYRDNEDRGTSLAAPHVAGAVAILRGAWPSKSAEMITTILFDTAEDLGAPGIDDVYGRGLLDLAEALRPQGALVLYAPSGASYPLAGSTFSPGATLGNFDHFAHATTAVFDKYKRDYRFDLSRAVRDAETSDFAAELHHQNSELNIETPAGFRFSQNQNALSILRENPRFALSFAHRQKSPNRVFAFSDQNDIDDFSENYSFYASPFWAQISNADAFNIRRAGKIRTAFGITRGQVADHPDFSVAGAHFSLAANPAENVTLAAQFGQIREDETFLSNYFSGAYQTDDATTRTLNLTARRDFGNGFGLVLRQSRGETMVENNPGAVVSLSEIATESRSLSLIKRGVLNDDDQLFLTFKNPLRVVSGTMTMRTADGLNADDSIRFSDKIIHLAPRTGERETALGYVSKFKNQTLTALLSHRQNPDNTDRSAENAVMVKMAWDF